MSEALLSKLELQSMLKVSIKTVDALIRDGRLPAAIELGPRMSRWRKADIEAWIAGGCQAPVSQESAQ